MTFSSIIGGVIMRIGRFGVMALVDKKVPVSFGTFRSDSTLALARREHRRGGLTFFPPSPSAPSLSSRATDSSSDGAF